MRPADTISRDRLPGLMARLGPASATTLAGELGVSVATLHRLLQENAGQVLSAGQARRSRHAWRRPLRDGRSTLPLAAIDAEGRAHDAGTLALVQPGGCWLPLAGTPWPLPAPAKGPRRDPLFDAMHDGWWPGLPYPLQDLRPQGYLGRQLARAGHAAWGVSPDPQRWSDDEVLQVLAQAGSDGPGDLVVGEAAVAAWQARRVAPLQMLPTHALGPAYAALADEAVAAGVAGSSAAGEFPKFPALRQRDGAATPHVLVKFSGAGGSAAEQRWADLLVCEHLALQALPTGLGLAAASSAIVQHADRTFLEVERFDRHGDWGRSPLVSLATLDAAFIGQGSGDWPALVARLVALGLIDDPDGAAHAAITRLWWFGRLIGNTDMHAGNLSFRPAASGRLRLAPAYDVLPMAWAPLPGGEVPPRDAPPPPPPPAQRAPWLQACAAAIAFWSAAAVDRRIGTGFRGIARAQADALVRLRDLV
jgi:hypothetical protein